MEQSPTFSTLFGKLFHIFGTLFHNLWNCSTKSGTFPLCVGLLGYCQKFQAILSAPQFDEGLEQRAEIIVEVRKVELYHFIGESEKSQMPRSSIAQFCEDLGF